MSRLLPIHSHDHSACPTRDRFHWGDSGLSSAGRHLYYVNPRRHETAPRRRANAWKNEGMGWATILLHRLEAPMHVSDTLDPVDRFANAGCRASLPSLK